MLFRSEGALPNSNMASVKHITHVRFKVHQNKSPSLYKKYLKDSGSYMYHASENQEKVFDLITLDLPPWDIVRYPEPAVIRRQSSRLLTSGLKFIKTKPHPSLRNTFKEDSGSYMCHASETPEKLFDLIALDVTSM